MLTRGHPEKQEERPNGRLCYAEEVVIMAWIAVHEQIDGAKLRQLKKSIGCSKAEAIGILVELWLWGIENADREGEIKSADKDDVAEIFAFDVSKKISPSSVIESLIQTGWIDLKEDRLFIHDWADWQEQWYKALDKREKDKSRKRAAAGNSDEIPPKFRGKSTENRTQPSPSPSPSPLSLSLPTPEPSSESAGAAAPSPAKSTKKQYGEYGWVCLSENEYARLLQDLGSAELDRCIRYIDESAQATGNKNKWKDWNLVIRKCHRDKWGMKPNPKGTQISGADRILGMIERGEFDSPRYKHSSCDAMNDLQTLHEMYGEQEKCEGGDGN